MENTKTDNRDTAQTDNMIFLQTIRDRLEKVNNEYSVAESLFQAGDDVPLVDTRVFAELPKEVVIRSQRVREAYIRPILHGGVSVPKLSIVIPVRGGADILAECLLSIRRQSFLAERAQDVQVIIVEDGIIPEAASVFANPSVQNAMSQISHTKASLKLLRLKTNQGRAQARNAGLAYADHDVVLFVDASMVLDEHFVVEHIWRHARLQKNFALLGFKENISWSAFRDRRDEIISGSLRANFQHDLKWNHTLKLDESGSDGFTFDGHHYQAGDTINYMQITRQFKNLTGIQEVGNRTLPSFFQTNIVSVKKSLVVECGGFEPFIQGWGLEDTFLGALLVARECLLIPCPSSVAFNIESEEESSDSNKMIDLEVNKRKYNELITKRRMDEYNSAKFQSVINLLESKLEVVPFQHERKASAALSISYPSVPLATGNGLTEKIHQVFWAESHDEAQRLVADSSWIRRRLLALFLLSDKLIFHPSYIWRSTQTRQAIVSEFAELFVPEYASIILGDSHNIEHYINDRFAKLESVSRNGGFSTEFENYKSHWQQITEDVPRLDSLFRNERNCTYRGLTESKDARFRRLLQYDLSDDAASATRSVRRSIVEVASRCNKRNLASDCCNELQQWAKFSTFVSREALIQYLKERGLPEVATSRELAESLLQVYLRANVDTLVDVPFLRRLDHTFDPYDPDLFEAFLKTLLGRKLFVTLYYQLSPPKSANFISDLKREEDWLMSRELYLSVLGQLSAHFKHELIRHPFMVNQVVRPEHHIVYAQLWQRMRMLLLITAVGAASFTAIQSEASSLGIGAGTIALVLGTTRAIRIALRELKMSSRSRLREKLRVSIRTLKA